MNYLDLAATWNAGKRFTLRAGINNVLDADPPISNGFQGTSNGNVFVQTYDALGRFIFLRAQVGF